MFSDTTDNSIQPSPDLNRALAEAMSDNFPDVAPLPGADTGKPAESSVVLKWSDPAPGARSCKHTILGIDYSPDHLTILEMRRSRRPSLIGLQVVGFDDPPSSAVLAGLLRDFNPAKHNCVQLTLTSARAVVRQFRLPPIPKRRRLAAATWEAQKLIPFSLKDSEAVFGFTFAPAPRKGWQVTLAAVPREDVCPVIEAIRDVHWTLGGVSIAGTQWMPVGGRLTDSEPAQTVAAVLWSTTRASFVVFHQHELKFHYDLGPMPLPVLPAGVEPAPEILRMWLKGFGKGIGEAFEFYGGAHPDLAVDRIDLYGITDLIAPLVTDWQERFGAPVAIVNPVRDLTAGLPDDVTEWLATKSSTLTTAVIAAAGTTTVDMTPAAMVKTRSRQKSERIARSVFVASVLAAVIWTGFLWLQRSLAVRSAARMQVQLDDLKKSPINGQVQQAAAQLQKITAMTAAAEAPSVQWAPYFKSVLSTCPPDLRLVSLLSESPQGVIPGTQPFPMIRLDGKILPAERSHALIYADWFGRMERVAGHGSVKLITDRTLDWKGQKTSVFSIEITPPAQAKGQTP